MVVRRLQPSWTARLVALIPQFPSLIVNQVWDSWPWRQWNLMCLASAVRSNCTLTSFFCTKMRPNSFLQWMATVSELEPPFFVFVPALAGLSLSVINTDSPWSTLASFSKQEELYYGSAAVVLFINGSASEQEGLCLCVHVFLSSTWK